MPVENARALELSAQFLRKMSPISKREIMVFVCWTLSTSRIRCAHELNSRVIIITRRLLSRAISVSRRRFVCMAYKRNDWKHKWWTIPYYKRLERFTKSFTYCCTEHLSLINIVQVATGDCLERFALRIYFPSPNFARHFYTSNVWTSKRCKNKKTARRRARNTFE